MMTTITMTMNMIDDEGDADSDNVTWNDPYDDDGDSGGDDDDESRSHKLSALARTVCKHRDAAAALRGELVPHALRRHARAIHRRRRPE